jgi:hypothetical protein
LSKINIKIYAMNTPGIHARKREAMIRETTSPNSIDILFTDQRIRTMAINKK